MIALASLAGLLRRSRKSNSQERTNRRWAAGRLFRAILPAGGYVVALALLANPAAGQDQTQELNFDNIKPVPVFTTGVGFISTFQGGTPHLGPLVSPVILAPLGRNWLIESRDTFESDLAPPPGGSGFKGVLKKEVDYLQIDYIANPYLTVTVGRFLAPFGIYNERLYPIWIRDLQSDPLILPIETGPSGAGTGAMLRGGFSLNPRVEVNYATYFSTLSTIKRLDSNRDAGFRAGLFLPGPRIEIGGSFQHLLQDDHSNAFGFHFEWQPASTSLDLRSEYARSHNGSGYWIEPAYRLANAPIWRHELRHVQMVARMQQFFMGTQVDGDLPGIDTNMFEFGLNYYFRDDIRFVSSYGRQFATGGNENIWTMGLTYRVALPMGHGDVQ
ncbi:MAG: hypothetical protein KGL02_07530 [Acidobacteriota bacterium]|nr:hypothetical protein [Acidobacteriota bacterium]